MTAALPPGFLARPFAHRALHGLGRPENGLAAVRAAVQAGYGIEIDVQPSSDGVAVVFHDHLLDRMTEESGPVSSRSAAALSGISLIDGAGEGVPTLAEVLTLVSGKVPLLIEIKDRDGALGPRVGPLEAAVAAALTGYGGPVAVMSFNPHSVIAMAREAPGVPRGLTTCAFAPDDWPMLPAETRDRLRAIPDYEAAGASFISHAASDLDRPRVVDLRAAGAAVLCWTIRTPESEIEALSRAGAVTFEGYRPR